MLVERGPCSFRAGRAKRVWELLASTHPRCISPSNSRHHIRADGVSWLAVPPGKAATAAQRHPNESKVGRLAVQELGFVA